MQGDKQTNLCYAPFQYVTRFLKSNKVDVGFVAHPSFITHEELGAIQGPFSIAAAGKLLPSPH